MRWFGRFTCASGLLVLGGLLHAQSDDAKNSAASVKSDQSALAPIRSPANPKKDAKAKSAITVTPQREAAVMTFVQRNHAELADLLGYLKTSQPDEYERAIKEIFRATERLDQIQDRDPLQYELEVAAWTAQSRVQLLAAKLKMGSSEEVRKQLREALKTQNEAKLSLLKHERQKVADRLSKLDSDITRYENDREKIIDRQLQLLTRAAAEGRPAKLGAKNAAKQGKKNVTTPETKPANQP
jgi:hypothetical protein